MADCFSATARLTERGTRESAFPAAEWPPRAVHLKRAEGTGIRDETNLDVVREGQVRKGGVELGNNECRAGKRYHSW